MLLLEIVIALVVSVWPAKFCTDEVYIPEHPCAGVVVVDSGGDLGEIVSGWREFRSHDWGKRP